MPRKTVLLLLTMFIITALIFTGCNAAQKPAPDPEPAPDPGITRSKDVEDPEKNKYQTQPATDEQAVKIAREADDVPGVAKATVVVSGSTAYIGLYLDSNEQTDAQTVKNNVRDKIARENDNIRTVYVTTDPKDIERINKVANGIADGKASSTSKELGELEELFRNRR